MLENQSNSSEMFRWVITTIIAASAIIVSLVISLVTFVRNAWSRLEDRMNALETKVARVDTATSGIDEFRESVIRTAVILKRMDGDQTKSFDKLSRSVEDLGAKLNAVTTQIHEISACVPRDLLTRLSQIEAKIPDVMTLKDLLAEQKARSAGTGK